MMDKVKLSGFKLDEVEMSIINKVIDKYVKRLSERMRFEELSLRLKERKHGKTYLHEVKGSLRVGKYLFNSELTDYNLIRVLSKVIDKLIREAEHNLQK